MVLDLHTPCLNAQHGFWRGLPNAGWQIIDSVVPTGWQMAINRLDNMGVWTKTCTDTDAWYTNTDLITCICICARIKTWKMDRLRHVTLGLRARFSIFCTFVYFYWMNAGRISPCISQTDLLVRSVPAPISSPLILPRANVKHLGVHTVCACSNWECARFVCARVTVCWLPSKPARLRVQHLWVQMFSNDMLMMLEGDKHRG